MGKRPAMQPSVTAQRKRIPEIANACNCASKEKVLLSNRLLTKVVATVPTFFLFLFLSLFCMLGINDSSPVYGQGKTPVNSALYFASEVGGADGDMQGSVNQVWEAKIT